jgi:DHA1 family bicyclomycin/chloramphenicol resistance-like MFS transporter
LAFVLGGYFLGTVISARVTVRIGFKRLVVAGIMISVIGAGAMLALVLGGLTSVITILIPQFIFMLGFGLVFPNAIAGALAPFPEKAGAASALLGFTQQSAGAIMVALLGALATGSAVPMAACIFAGAVISVACFVLIVPKPAAAGDTTENG